MRLPDTIEKGTRITATEYATKHGITVKVLVRAVDAGHVRAELVQTGKRCIRLLDEGEADEDIAKLPRCPHEGCDRPVFPPSLACCGPHARAIETKGTTVSDETRRKMSIGKEFTPRPDVAERMKRDWCEGGPMTRGLFYDEDGNGKRYFKPVTRQRWKGRWAPTGGRPRLNADPYYDAKIAEIQKAYVESYDETTGKYATERALALMTRTTRYMVGIALVTPPGPL
jgi:hypothetical protein